MVSRVGKLAAATLLAAAGASAAHSESFGIDLVLRVPVMCKVSAGASGVGAGSTLPGSFDLGELQEFCNAPRGYDLLVHYTPGTLKGMTLIAGDARVQLDGSGSAVVGHSSTPAVRVRKLEAIPGPQGFDADHLDFETVAAPF